MGRYLPVVKQESTNAGFSAASGLVLLIAPGSIGDVIGVEADWFMRAFGVALLAHAALLLVVRRPDVERWAQLNLAAMVLYSAAMVAVAATVANGDVGRVLVLADGAAIALVAVALVLGLRKATTSPGREY